MTTWPYIKELITSLQLPPHYFETTDWYDIKMYNGAVFLAECMINKNTELEYKDDFETNYKPNANRKVVTSNGDIRSSDGLRNGGAFGVLTLTSANTAYEAKVGGSRLSHRKSLSIYADENMFLGYDNTVTASTGFPLFKHQTAVFSIEPDSTFQVWLVCESAGKTARILECP